MRVLNHGAVCIIEEMKSRLERLEWILFSLLIFFLPTQLGKHFWPSFSIVDGIRVDYLSPTLYGTDVLVGLLFFSWFLRKAVAKPKTETQQYVFTLKQFTPGVKLFMVFVSYLAITIAFSGRVVGGIYGLIKFLEFSFLAFYIAGTIRQTKQILWMLQLWSVSALFESLLAIAQYWRHSSLGGVFYFFGERFFTAETPGIANASVNGELILRPYATFSHPNVLAGYLLITLLLALFFFPQQKKFWKKVLLVAILIVGTIALLLTLSRVAILLWTILLGILLVRDLIRHARIKKGQVFVWTVLLIGFVSLIFVSPVSSRIFRTSLTEQSVVQREAFADAAWQMIIHRPVGVGLGNFLPSLATMQQPFSSAYDVQPVHNIFLLTAAETGIIGLIVLLWFLFKTYKNLLILPYALSLGISLTALLVLGMFDHYLLTLQQGQLLFVVVIGLCWADLRIGKTEVRISQNRKMKTDRKFVPVKNKSVG